MISINIDETTSKDVMANNLRIIASMIEYGYIAGCDPGWSTAGEEEVECDMCGEYFTEDELEKVSGELLCSTCYEEMLEDGM